jgi:predicted permease
VLLALFGATAGFLLAFWAANAISSFQIPLPIPIVFDFTPDLRVLAFTAALSVFTGILFGLAPALRATRLDLVTALKSETNVFGRSRRLGMRDVLVIVQVALSLVLLTGSGLFLRSLQHASSIDIGMRPDNVLLMAVDPKLHRYSREKTQQFLSQLRERVAALPEVRKVTFLDSVPLSFGGTSYNFSTEGGKDSVKTVNADVYGVGVGFFETMQLPLRRGREFNLQSDSADTVILNENLARQLFPDSDPIGQQVTSEKRKLTVIGIAGNTKSRTLGEEPVSCVYQFMEPRPDEVMSFYGISIAVKTSGNPRRMIRPIRDQIAALDPTMAIFNIETMQEHVNKAMLIPRVCAMLLAVFGGVGLILAAIGLYGVMSYSVRRRTREFGIRIALGAPNRSVLALVARQGLWLAGVGIAIGLGIALGLSRFASSLLYGISATDAVTFVAVPTTLAGVALVAVLVPAIRAARVSPMSSLRYE